MYSITEYFGGPMQINRIKVFLAVVISGTFSEAAEILYTTQASVSKQIMALEKELDIQLFNRSRRRAELTPAGKVFLDYAKKLLDTYNEMTNALGEVTAHQSMQTTLASLPIMAQYGFISLISEFRKAHPKVSLIVDEREASDIINGLNDGQYELAFVRSRGLDHAKYQQILLYHDRLAVMLPAEHPLAKEKTISILQLKEETFLMLGKQTSYYELFFEVCRQYGDFIPKIGYTGTHMESVVGMVSKNMGISLMMDIPARFMQRNNTAVVALKEDILSSVVLARMRKRSPSLAGNLFWSYIRAWSVKNNKAQEVEK